MGSPSVCAFLLQGGHLWVYTVVFTAVKTGEDVACSHAGFEAAS